MLELGFGIVALLGFVAVLGIVSKLAGGVLGALVTLVVLPFELLGTVLALVGGLFFVPIVLLAALLLVLGLVGGLVLLPLAPFALLGLGIAAMVRFLRPHRA
jgi:hypothetical protein